MTVDRHGHVANRPVIAVVDAEVVDLEHHLTLGGFGLLRLLGGEGLEGRRRRGDLVQGFGGHVAALPIGFGHHWVCLLSRHRWLT